MYAGSERLDDTISHISRGQVKTDGLLMYVHVCYCDEIIATCCTVGVCGKQACVVLSVTESHGITWSWLAAPNSDL